MLTLQPSLPSGMAQRERCTAVRPGLPSPALVQVRRLTRRALRSRKNSLCTCKLIALGAQDFESVWLSSWLLQTNFAELLAEDARIVVRPPIRSSPSTPQASNLRQWQGKIRAKEPASLTVHGVEEAMEKAPTCAGKLAHAGLSASLPRHHLENFTLSVTSRFDPVL